MKKIKINWNADKTFYLIMIGACFLLYCSWSLIIPFNHAPDEYMRYSIPDFIYQYGKLPAGDDERLRNEIWGFSYGFMPVLSYMVSALFMKIAGIFSTAETVLLEAARLASVCFSLGTVCFSVKIGNLLFDKLYAKLFVVSIAFLPQFVFISSYVNTDAFGIFTVSWIIYAMLLGKSKKWRFKDCIFLGTGIGLCLLSYYNCYGIIIAAILYCVKSVLDDTEIEHKTRFILTRCLWVFLAAAIISGWWFLRNFILYDGDIFGLRALNECKELYAQDPYKPSNINTPQKMGVSLRYMLFDMRWLSITILSFIGVFDYFSIYLHDSSYRIMKLLFMLGIAGWFIHIGRWRREKPKYNNLTLHIVMILMCIITISLSLYNSYFNDFQPQGRYLLPMLLPFNILLVHGWHQLTDTLLHEKKSYAVVSFIVIYLMIIFSATTDLIIPVYLSSP